MVEGDDGVGEKVDAIGYLRASTTLTLVPMLFGSEEEGGV
jgi:hypothetical protein